MKVVTVVGTRPEIIRLSRVMPKLDQVVDHVVVHTGQNYDYELNQVFFEQLELRVPDHYLGAAGKTPCETIGAILSRVDEVLDTERPDALLVLGDTNSCLAAYPAKRRKIPVFHMEAGNRCFDERVPEEINRRIVDHISDVNLPYSSISREYLLKEGLPPDRTIKTGSPMFEVLHHYRAKIDASPVLQRLGLEESEFYLLSVHREENVDSPVQFEKFISLLNALAKKGKRVIVSTHPRTRTRIESSRAVIDPRIELMKPMGFLDYVRLELAAKAVLSDSGTITEESSILNFRALNLRQAHERPEGFEEASVMMTGLDVSTVELALDALEHQTQGHDRSFRIVNDYSVPNVSDKIVRIIISYTGYINRVVWGRT